MHKPPTLAELRAAAWALRSVRSARRQLGTSGYDNLSLPPVPTLPVSASRGVHAVLRRLPSTCLERAVVLQRWRAAQGDAHDVVIGVKGSRDDFRAHAWLDDERSELDDFHELVRLRP